MFLNLMFDISSSDQLSEGSVGIDLPSSSLGCRTYIPSWIAWSASGMDCPASPKASSWLLPSIRLGPFSSWCMSLYSSYTPIKRKRCRSFFLSGNLFLMFMAVNPIHPDNVNSWRCVDSWSRSSVSLLLSYMLVSSCLTAGVDRCLSDIWASPLSFQCLHLRYASLYVLLSVDLHIYIYI